jgi:hypothetical protein
MDESINTLPDMRENILRALRAFVVKFMRDIGPGSRLFDRQP